MNNEVIVTCAVTGAGDTLEKHPEVPVTPKQISEAAIAAAKAGASAAHIHVRDPKTGMGSRDITCRKAPHCCSSKSQDSRDTHSRGLCIGSF